MKSTPKLLIFQEGTLQKNKKKVYPQKISYISGNGTLNPKIKKFLIF